MHKSSTRSVWLEPRQTSGALTADPWAFAGAVEPVEVMRCGGTTGSRGIHHLEDDGFYGFLTDDVAMTDVCD